jgi:hypothetical protein
MSNNQMDSIHSGARAKLWSRIQPHCFLACSLLEFTTAIRAAYYHNNKISIYWIFKKTMLVLVISFIHTVSAALCPPRPASSTWQSPR